VVALEADISGDIPITALNRPKSIDLDNISGKAPLILTKIWLFPNLNGIFPSIFQTE
jgi:hypothetical protein